MPMHCEGDEYYTYTISNKIDFNVDRIIREIEKDAEYNRIEDFSLSSDYFLAYMRGIVNDDIEMYYEGEYIPYDIKNNLVNDILENRRNDLLKIATKYNIAMENVNGCKYCSKETYLNNDDSDVSVDFLICPNGDLVSEYHDYCWNNGASIIVRHVENHFNFCPFCGRKF